MHFRPVTFDRLTAEERAAWCAIQRDEPHLISPFFRPEFTQAVATVRNNVEVCLLEQGGRPVGFLPYCRTNWNSGTPVGGRLSDYHGVIAGGQVDYDPIRMVRECRLSSMHFDHWVGGQEPLSRFTWRHADSPHVDLSEGFDAYLTSRSGHMRSELRRKRRILERKIGVVRFDPDVRDASILSTLIDWKIRQCQRTGALNVLRFPWVRELLEDLLKFRGEHFAATMAVLYAGNRVLAIAYMLRSAHVLHGWFTAFDRDAARFSPGLQLVMEILRTAPASGVTRLDFGKGPEGYKQRFENGATRVGEGCVDPSAVKAGARRAWRAIRSSVRSTPLSSPLRRPAGALYQLRGWLELR